MAYTTETKVYDRVGLSSSAIQSLSGKNSSEVTTLVDTKITDARDQIREDIGYPVRIVRELHYGDGDKNVFDLGPEDDPYAEEGDYDPQNGLVEIYNAWFGRYKRRKPWPEDCDSFSENDSDSWTSSNATISDEGTIVIAGDYSIKAIVSAASGYAQYPDNDDTQYLDKKIDSFSDIFFWFRTSNASVTFTISLFDKDGNSDTQTFTVRQNNIGQYVWLDIDSFSGSIDWNNTRFQYLRISASASCTFYVDNLCFADGWSFTAPTGYFHVSVADNVSSESGPGEGFPFFLSYSYDPFLGTVPNKIAEATEWWTGVLLIDYMRGIRYEDTSFEVFGDTLELDTDSGREALIGIRTKMERMYFGCLKNWGGPNFGGMV